MGAPDLLNVLKGMGLRLTAHGSNLHVAPRTAITDEARSMIRDHKAELLAALQTSADSGTATNVEPGSDPRRLAADAVAQRRHGRVVAMLTERPEAQRAVYCDGIPVNGLITIYVAIRYAGGIATAAIEVQGDRYDGIALLDLIEKHGATVH